jgi:hypothetical protein
VNLMGMKRVEIMTTTANLIMKVILTTNETPHPANKPELRNPV